MKVANTAIAGSAATRDTAVKSFKKRYAKVTVVRHKTSATLRAQRRSCGPYWYEVRGWA